MKMFRVARLSFVFISITVIKSSFRNVEDASCIGAPIPLKLGGPGYRGILWQAREREPIMGVWAQSPQQGPGAELPLVRRSGGQSPLKS